MGKKSVQPGDVFEVILGDGKGYLQYVANDESELGAPVVRAFQRRYEVSEQPSLSQITDDLVDFHTHTFIRTGLKLGLWTKIGNSEVAFQTVLFRHSLDYGRRIVEVSYDWVVWEINGPKMHIGPMIDAYRSAELGEVNPPYLVVERMASGDWTFPYPNFQ